MTAAAPTMFFAMIRTGILLADERQSFLRKG
jgi:hypothetical protein